MQHNRRRVACFDKVRMHGSHGIKVNPFGPDAVAAPSLNRVINDKDRSAFVDEDRDNIVFGKLDSIVSIERRERLLL
jgi:hypothetical protein